MGEMDGEGETGRCPSFSEEMLKIGIYIQGSSIFSFLVIGIYDIEENGKERIEGPEMNPT